VRSPALAVLRAVSGRRPPSPARGANIGAVERAATVATGTALLALLARRPSLLTAVAGLAGSALVYRGARGRSRLYEAIGVSTVRPDRVERVMTVNRPPADLHQAWRDPALRGRVLRDAQELDLLTDSAEELIAWRERDLGRGGHMSFRRASGGRGTEVRLALEGVSASDADQVLRRFKQLMEAGEIPVAAA